MYSIFLYCTCPYIDVLKLWSISSFTSVIKFQKNLLFNHLTDTPFSKLPLFGPPGCFSDGQSKDHKFINNVISYVIIDHLDTVVVPCLVRLYPHDSELLDTGTCLPSGKVVELKESFNDGWSISTLFLFLLYDLLWIVGERVLIF